MRARLLLGALLVCAGGLAGTAAVAASSVRLALPDGRVVVHPTAVALDTPFEFTQGNVHGAVAPRYRADLSQAWFEMAAGVSFNTVCGTVCTAQTVNLGSFLITQSISLRSPDRRPIEVTASWTTLAQIDLPADAWINAQFKLGLLSGGFARTPERNVWLECWANTASAAARANCPTPPFSVQLPMGVPDTRSFTLLVSSGSVLQLEVAAALMAQVPVPAGSSGFSGSFLLDPWLTLTVPAGTIVDAGAFPVTTVPLPHSGLLALAGLAALAGVMRRRVQPAAPLANAASMATWVPRENSSGQA